MDSAVSIIYKVESQKNVERGTMYIQVIDNMGMERFIEEEQLENCISSGEVVAFRRSDGWMKVPEESVRGELPVRKRLYGGQERRRSLLGKRKANLPDT